LSDFCNGNSTDAIAKQEVEFSRLFQADRPYLTPQWMHRLSQQTSKAGTHWVSGSLDPARSSAAAVNERPRDLLK
jgi:hypothetical protein